MTPKYKTRDVAKALYANYLKKAEECLHAAKNSLASQKWNAAVINAIHSCISAGDAFCVYFLGKRYAGEFHDDAVKLFMTVKNNDERINENANRFLRIIRIKNMAEYEERLVYRAEAEKILKDCERFFEYIKKELPHHG